MVDCNTLPAHTGISTQTASVYRYYDSDDILVYVGVTKRGLARNLEHASHKEWWPFVSRQEVKHYPTYTEALAEEKALILARRPIFNKQHNPDHKAMRKLYMAQATTDKGMSLKARYEMYCKLNHILPLCLVNASLHNDEAVFQTYPAHYALTRSLTLNKHRVQINNQDGTYIGKVNQIANQGLVCFFRCKLNDSAAIESQYAYATTRLRTHTKPVVMVVTGLVVTNETTGISCGGA